MPTFDKRSTPSSASERRCVNVQISDSDEHAVAVIDLVLDDLRGPVGEGGVASASLACRVIDLDAAETWCVASPCSERQPSQASYSPSAAVICGLNMTVIALPSLVDEGDHALRLAYHVRRHAHAFFAVRGERLLQILRNGGVERVGWVGGVAGT